MAPAKKKAAKKKATRKTAGKTTGKTTKKKAPKKKTPAKKAAPPKKLPREGLSMRDYAKHRLALGLPGGSHPAVGKAIRAGRLTSRSAIKVGKRWMIDPEQADAEWESSTHAGKTRNPKKISKGRLAAAAKAREQIDDEHLSQPSLFGADHDPRPQNEETKLVPAGDKNSTAQVTRAGLFYSAQLKRLEYLERSEKLVMKDSVEAEVFASFRALRDLAFGIPDRIGAILAAETDENAVRALLREHIRETFEALANDLQRG